MSVKSEKVKMPDAGETMEELASSADMERFRHWKKQYKAFMNQNRAAFEKQGIEVARAYLTGSIDARLAARLATLKDDQGVATITDEMPIDGILEAMEKLYLDATPLWRQRMDYFKTYQGPNQRFEDWWAHMTLMKENCQLLEGMT